MNHTVSNKALVAKTGNNWQSWVVILDSLQAYEKNHKEIVALLHEHYTLDPWWAQTICVGYEQEKGLRQKHEMPQGYEISKSKTFASPLESLFESVLEFLNTYHLVEIKGYVLHKNIKLRWKENHTPVLCNFYNKNGKTQLVIQHLKLQDIQQAETMKSFWHSFLQNLNK